MAFIKHVGKHGDKKVVIVFRKVSKSEDHMALVLYTDTIPSSIHDTVIQTLESPAGQQVDTFAEALNRALLPDGRNVLHVIHEERYLKKVPTNQVIVTPTTKSTVRLDELNQILDDLETGGDAAAKLRELDSKVGLQDPAANQKAETIMEAAQDANINIDPMSDEGIAQSLIDQANKMSAEAAGLAAESERMLKEAYAMAPSLKPKRATSKKKTSKKVSKKTAVKKTATKQSV
jgi:hypothetical protein